MDAKFINYKSIKTSKSCRLLLNFSEKINLERSET